MTSALEQLLLQYKKRDIFSLIVGNSAHNSEFTIVLRSPVVRVMSYESTIGFKGTSGDDEWVLRCAAS